MANPPPPPQGPNPRPSRSQRPNQPTPEEVKAAVERVLNQIGGAFQKAKQERAAGTPRERAPVNKPRDQSGTQTDRSAVLWFLGLIPILFACLHLMIVARGDTETLRALVQSLNVPALVLGTVLPLGGAALTMLALLFVLQAITSPKGQRSQRTSNALVGLLFVAFIDYFAMPMLYYVIIGGIIIALVLFAIMLAIAFTSFGIPHRSESAQKVVQGGARMWAIGIMLAPLVVMLGFVGVWMPQERITLGVTQIEPVYILSVDDRWTKYMDGEHRVHIVPTPDVTGRDLVDVPRSAWLKTVHGLLQEQRASGNQPPPTKQPGPPPPPAPSASSEPATAPPSRPDVPGP